MIDLTEEFMSLQRKAYRSYLLDEGFITPKFGGDIVAKPFKVGSLELEYRRCVYTYELEEAVAEVVRTRYANHVSSYLTDAQKKAAEELKKDMEEAARLPSELIGFRSDIGSEMLKENVGLIGNYYGGLTVKKNKDGKCYWAIENHDGHDWQEIPRWLFDTLLCFAAESDRGEWEWEQ